MPALHGFYRAISSTAYGWTIAQWESIHAQFKILCSPSIVDRLNHLGTDILQKESVHAGTLAHVQAFVSRYVAQGRPLSGYFLICCILETEWTILAQALVPGNAPLVPVEDAAAANRAWVALTRNPAHQVRELGIETKDTLRETVKNSLQCFNDLLLQIEEMDCEPPMDTYAWETMSESLVRFSRISMVCACVDTCIETGCYLLPSPQRYR